jgi:hypothetical protein
VLILGSAGADTITDTGSDNCIVGGGGTGSVIGTVGDICISVPTLAVASPCPTGTTTTTTTTVPTTTTTTTAPSNGVTATPSLANYNNYGGQERLALTNTYAITALSITIDVAATTGVTFKQSVQQLPGRSLDANLEYIIGREHRLLLCARVRTDHHGRVRQRHRVCPVQRNRLSSCDIW